jgi:hypothetical protein
VNSFTSHSDDGAAAAVKRQARFYLGWLFAVVTLIWALAWIYVGTMPMAFLSRDYPLWVAKKAMMDDCNLGSVEVIGDSRAVAAVMPKVMPVKAANLAMSGTGPIESYFTVRRSLRCPVFPKVVVFAHGAPHFESDSSFWRQSPLLGILNYHDLRDIDKEAAKLADVSAGQPTVGDGVSAILTDWLYSIHFPPLYFPSLANGYLAARWWHNMKALDDTRSSRGQAPFGTADGSNGLADESSMRDFSAAPLSDYYFSKILSVLREKGVRVLYIAMPINQSTYDRIEPEVETGFLTYLRGKEKEFSNFQVIGPAIACWPDAYFGDAWHFNLKGAETFSRELGDWLEAVMGGTSPVDFRDRCARPTGMETRNENPRIEPGSSPKG